MTHLEITLLVIAILLYAFGALLAQSMVINTTKRSTFLVLIWPFVVLTYPIFKPEEPPKK